MQASTRHRGGECQDDLQYHAHGTLGLVVLDHDKLCHAVKTRCSWEQGQEQEQELT